MVIKYKRPTHPVHPFADEKEPRPPEYETTQPSAPRALKKDGTPRKPVSYTHLTLPTIYSV